MSSTQESRRRYDMSIREKSKAQGRCEALVPGGYYRLGDRIVCCVLVGGHLCEDGSGEDVGKGSRLLLYDSQEFRHRIYGNGDFGLIWFPNRWWEVRDDGRIVQVRQTGLTSEDMEPIDDSEVGEELEALGTEPEYLELREGMGGDIVHISETDLTLGDLEPLSEEEIGPEHMVVEKGTGYWEIKQVDGEKTMVAVVEDGVWFDRK